MKKLTNQDYLVKFAKLNEIEQVLVLSEALNVSEEVAKTYLNLILTTIERKNYLFSLFSRKKDNLKTLKPLLKQINDSTIKQIKSKNKTKETHLQIKIKALLPEIQQMRQAGIGWRRISNYLGKERKVRTSANTARRYYEKYKYLLNQ